MEAGHNLTTDHRRSHPADILLPSWNLGKPAAIDLSVTLPLNPLTLTEVGVTAGAAVWAIELRKHTANEAGVTDGAAARATKLRKHTANEAGVTAGAATELKKHMANDRKCIELCCECIPMVAESYGASGGLRLQLFFQQLPHDLLIP